MNGKDFENSYQLLITFFFSCILNIHVNLISSFDNVNFSYLGFYLLGRNIKKKKKRKEEGCGHGVGEKGE